jgi:hypothetical protein|tara:strand:- start:1204 stop:1347 length:144 start_codon:yes stop_codon:yes gene_type:complete
MAQWYMANGPWIKPPYPRTTDHESLVIGSTKPWKKIQDAVNMGHEKA